MKPLADDLAAQHRAIMELVAPRDPATALDLMWRFTACGTSVFARSDRLGEVFRGGGGWRAPARLSEELPDFEDIETDQRAFVQASTSPTFTPRWPS